MRETAPTATNDAKRKAGGTASVGEGLAVQAQRPQFKPLKPYKAGCVNTCLYTQCFRGEMAGEDRKIHEAHS